VATGGWSDGAGIDMAEAGGATMGELFAGAAGAVAVMGAGWVALGAEVVEA